MSTTPSARPDRRLAVFCDGTWVGRETEVEDAPPSNIRQLANMVGHVQYSTDDKTAAKVHHIQPHRSRTQNTNPDIIAGYQEGVGLNKTFLQYIWDGATASTIGDECIAVYKFIVENFTNDHEVWLFGFSRGAFTVRCVAGMINNCGIIKRLPEYTDAEVHRLCYEVFRTYRSNLPVDAPKSEECQRWKGLSDRVWQVKRPIRFMGIIDTVGALGIPRLNAGIGFDWSPFEFFDQTVSSVVQHVYHAPCIHDRLWIFQPCLVYPNEEEVDGKEKALVHQRWFPGTHYDVGRMTFRFIRQSPTNWIEGALGWLPDLLSRTIYPNEVLSDTVLRWLVQGVQREDAGSRNQLIPNAKEHIERLDEDIRLAAPAFAQAQTGSGDIYGDVLAYAPGGRVFSAIQRSSRSVTGLLNNIFPRLGDKAQGVLGFKTLLSILTATADRRIPGTQANIYPYMEKEIAMSGKKYSVEQLARLNEDNERGTLRYPSQTVEAFLLWKRVFGQKTETRDFHEVTVEQPLNLSNAGREEHVPTRPALSQEEVTQYGREGTVEKPLNVGHTDIEAKSDQDSVTRHEDTTTKGYASIEKLVSYMPVGNNAISNTITWEWEVPNISTFDLHDQIVLVCTNLLTQGAGNVGQVHATTYLKFLRGLSGWSVIEKIVDKLPELQSGAGDASFRVEPASHVSITCSRTHLSLELNAGRLSEKYDSLIETLDWFCKAVRIRPATNGHFFASASYHLEPWRYPGTKIDHPRGAVRLQLSTLSLFEDNCWLSLFDSCVVVETAVTRRKRPGKGLEMSFDLMVNLAASESCIRVKDTQILLGYRTVLYPVAIHEDHVQFYEDCVQFHLITTSHGQINPYTLELKNALPISEEDDLLAFTYSRFGRRMRCVVGWCDIAHINLGTKRLPTTIKYSGGKDQPKSLVSDGYATLGQIGLSAPFSAIGGLQKNFKYASHRIRFTPFDNYRCLLHDSSRQPVVLYDAEQRRCWLVPKLNVLLHMSQAYSATSAAGPAAEIPYAEPETDAEALKSMLALAGETSVSEDPTAELLLRELMFQLSVRLLNTTDALRESSRGKLYGFEYRDIIHEPGKGSCMKELNIKADWIDLVNEVGTVIVCSGLGEVISAAGDSRKCDACNTVPKDRDYFTATIPCLLRLAEQRNVDLTVGNDYIKIADKSVWKLVEDPFLPCPHGSNSNESCWERRGLVQQLARLGFLHLQALFRPGKTPPARPARALPPNGAVVFGKV